MRPSFFISPLHPACDIRHEAKDRADWEEKSPAPHEKHGRVGGKVTYGRRESLSLT